MLGRVPDVAPLYRRATLALAPLLSGGGTRIKMLEAAAHRTASVATERAAAGIGWPEDAGGWRVTNASEFAGACHAALASAAERDRRATRGLDWVTRHHSRPHVVSRLCAGLYDGIGSGPGDRERGGGCKVTSTAGRVYKTREGLEASEVDDGYVIYDESHARILFLNSTAAAVLELCDGESDLKTIASTLQSAFNLPRAPVSDVAACLEALVAQGLVTDCSPSSSAA